ncbi:DNA polymerase III subunit delta [Desulfovibrionales bacterium]
MGVINRKPEVKSEEIDFQCPSKDALDMAYSLRRSQTRVISYLEQLAEPPQSLLIEGSSVAEREAAVLFYAARLNCLAPQPPCLGCSTCLQLFTGQHRDLLFFDGRTGSIKVDSIRCAIRPLLGDPPRSRGKRVIIFHEAQALTVAAANALLKFLEEPRPWTVFVLSVAQRERLLPTLVSRSWILTLGWKVPTGEILITTNQKLVDWLQALTDFLVSGRGWFSRTATKGAVDRELARDLILICQAELIGAMIGRPTLPLGEAFVHNCDAAGLDWLNVCLIRTQEALDAQVNVALVLDWLAMQLYRLR